MALISKPYTFSAGAVIVAAEHNSNFDAIYADYNGNITNANLSASAAIALSKISFTTALTMSGAILKPTKGADVASVAGAITLGEDGNQFDITGTNAITSITAKTAGTFVILQFDSTASLVDGSNLKINGNMTGAAESTITLYCDGTNWFEISRSPVTYVPSTSNALSGSVIQTVQVQLTTPVDVTGVPPQDDTTPLYQEGTAIGNSGAFTPTNSSNLIVITMSAWGTQGSQAIITFWINDATGTDAALAVRQDFKATNEAWTTSIEHVVAAGSTSARTYYFVGGVSTSTNYVGRGASGTDLFGAAAFGSITIQEVKA